MIAINFLLFWDFPFQRHWKKQKSTLLITSRRWKGFVCFTKSCAFLKLQSSLDLFGSPNYSVLLSVYIQIIHELLEFITTEKKIAKILLFSTIQTISFSTRKAIVLCTSSMVLLGCRPCMRFCTAVTRSLTVVRKNKVTIKEELFKNLIPHKVLN